MQTASAFLPTQYGDFTAHAFKSKDEKEHFAVVKGSVRGKRNVLVRIHSSCLTGDVFHSQKCDCRQQFEQSLKLISKKGGVLVYLDQEGRGIGLHNKIRAYALQEKGMDTFQANRALGFKEDDRHYAAAVEILKLLQVKSVRLLTSNKRKEKELQASGIAVTQTIPLKTKPTKHNRKYLQAKKAFANA
ncbi:MAG: GTP cyclohydrolase II [Candidatus Norongarragalinales archaeon]